MHGHRRGGGLQALKQEISNMKSFQHPNIVKLHYIFEDALPPRTVRLQLPSSTLIQTLV
jgi:serine/threonine protein kinase